MRRRDFLQVGAIAGGGLIVGVCVPQLRALADQATEPNASVQMNVYLSIALDGTVTITAPVPEIGQGVRTALPMLVAEELDISWEDVEVVQAAGSQAYEGRNQRAAGSNSVRVYFMPMRLAGAIARDLLVRTAAESLDVSREMLTTRSGHVVHTSTGRQLNYGSLASRAAKLDPDPNVPLKSASEFEILGRATRSVDAHRFVKGTANFGMDVRVADMVSASIERCPVFGGKVIDFDDTEARRVTGFLEAVKVESFGNPDRPFVREGVAIIATNTWAAFEARKRLRVTWDEGPNAGESTTRLHKICNEQVERPAPAVRSDGDAYVSFENAHRTTSATYHVPFLVHNPMETMNCTADAQTDRIDVWVPTQMPAITQNALASLYKLPMDAIRINPTFVGGGFGRRLSYDFVIEAIELSRAVKKPVQVVWTREDEITQGHFRPFSYHRLEGAIDGDNQVVGWLHRQSGTSRYAFRTNEDPANSEFFPNDFPANLVPNFRLEYALAQSNLPAVLLRAPGHNALAFVIESFLDELAYLAGEDPLEFRLRLFRGNNDYVYEEEDDDPPKIISVPRMRAVLKKAASEASWGDALPDGEGLGIACHYTQGSYAAHVIHVAADSGSSFGHRVLRVVSAVDCGRVINPLGLEAQVVGGVVDGISAAIYGEIRVEDGRVQQDNFDSCPLLRFSQAPEVEAFAIDSEFPPTGIGEPPYPPVAPALCNAIFAASGIRHRRLPLVRSGGA